MKERIKMYSVTAYSTDVYNSRQTIHKEFCDITKMWDWCKGYLSSLNHKVIVHRIDKRWKWGMNRERKREYIRKIGVFTKVEEIPHGL